MNYESQEEHDHYEGAMEQGMPQEEPTPEKSVEERGKLESTWIPFISDSMQKDAIYEVIREVDRINKTLKTERQKRDEMVKEALEEAGNYVDELYQSGNMGENEYELLTDFFDEKLLTQPNNK